MKQAVFLDRDGTINQMVYNPEFGIVDSPLNPGEFHLIPGVAEAISTINQLGLLALVVSNQPGIAKGKFSPLILEQITLKMHQLLAEAGAHVDHVYYCIHHPDAQLLELRQNCQCRKPEPGLLIKAAEDFGIDLKKSFLVGDGITDILAGRRAGVQTFYVGTPKGYICEEFERKFVSPDYMISNLSEMIPMIKNIITNENSQV